MEGNIILNGVDNTLGAFRSIQKSLTQTAEKATETSEEISSSFEKAFSGIKGVAAAGLGAMGLKEFASQVVKVRAEFQDTESMFKVFLGDAEKATQHVKDLQKYAFNNVFEFSDLTKASAQLLAYGTQVEDVTHVINQLSEVAAGTNGNLHELVDVYNRVKATDTLDSRVLGSLAAKGIRVDQLLAEARGLDSDVIKKMTLHFSDLQEALTLVTEEGGMFYGMMAEKSKNIGDSIGYLEDNMTAMFNDIGTKFQEPIHDAIYALAELIEEYQKIGAVVGGVATSFGTYKLACMAATVATKIAAESAKGYTFWQQVQIQTELLLTKAINAKNAALIANPYAAVVAAITAAIAGLVVAIKLWKASEDEEDKALKRVNKELERRTGLINQQLKDSDEWITTLQNEKSTVNELADAYENLANMEVLQKAGYSEADIRNMNVGELKDLIKRLTEETAKAEESNMLDNYFTDYNTYKSQFEKFKQSSLNKEGRLFAMQQMDASEAAAFRTSESIIEKQLAEVAKLEDKEKKVAKLNHLISSNEERISSLAEESLEYRVLAEAVEKYRTELEAVNNTTSDTEAKKQNKEYWETQKKNATSIIEDMETSQIGSEEYEKQVALIMEANTNLKKYQIVNEEDLQEKLLQARKKALLDRQKLNANVIKNEWEKNEALRRVALAEIDEQERIWNKANPTKAGSNKGNFDLMRGNVNMEYDQKTNKIVEDTNRLLLTLNRTQASLNGESWIARWTHELNDLNPSLEEQLDLIKKIADKQLEMEKANIMQQMEDELKQVRESVSPEKLSAAESAVRSKYDKMLETARLKSETETNRKVNETKLQAYSAYAAKVLEIETRLADDIKAIQEDTSLSVAEKGRNIGELTAKAGTDKQVAAFTELAGVIGEATEVEIAQIVDTVLSMTIDTISAEIPKVLTQLQSLKAAGQDTAQLEAYLNTLLARQSQLVGKATDESKKSRKKQTENWKAVAESLRTVADAIGEIESAFADELNDAAKSALDTCKTVAVSTGVLITGIVAITDAAAESMAAAEKASVILTIISAAVQIITAIVNALVKNVSAYAKAKNALEDQQKTTKQLIRDYEALEFAQKSKTGREYWKDQWMLISKAQEQVHSYTQELAYARQMMDAAKSDKKRENAEDEYNEILKSQREAQENSRALMDEFYEELITTNAQSFAEGLADAIMEGFANGMDGLGDIWDDAFDELMRSMLTKQISLDLTERLSDTFERIRDAFGRNDTELDEAEIESIRAEYELAKAEAEARLNQYKRLYDELDLDDSVDVEGSRGAFEGMSSEQADALDGRFAALQMIGINIEALEREKLVYVEDIRDSAVVMANKMQELSEGVSLGVLIAQDQLTQLERIADNTDTLADMDIRLRNIENNTSRL